MGNESLAELVKVHRNSDEIDFNAVWREGLFIFDTNVFLDLYRLPISARKDLMSALENKDFNKRVWTGFQVAMEFLNNRHEAISDQKNKFSKVKSLIDVAMTESQNTFTELTSEVAKLRLRQRHSLINPDVFLSEYNIVNSTKFLADFLAELDRLEKEQFDVNEHDSIKDFVLRVLDGRTGEPFNASELEKIYRDGEKRYLKEIPPGFKDKKKEGSYFFREVEYLQRYGDLIFWNEIIKKANESGCKYIVLVTGDVKEDWWAEKRGKKLGPRKELLNEIYTAAPTLDVFHMYDTSAFLNYAKAYLKIDILESSIAETKDLIELNIRERVRSESRTIIVEEFLEDIIASYAKDLNVEVHGSVSLLPPISVPSLTLYNALHEIFSNAVRHSLNQYLLVRGKSSSSDVTLRFENQRNPSSILTPVDPHLSRIGVSSKGIGFVMDRLETEGIHVKINRTEKWFGIDLIFPISNLQTNP